MPAGATKLAIPLPASLDTAAVEALASSLLAARGRPVTLDASAVQRLGGLCLQVLLSARRTWAADRVGFEVAGASDYFRDAMARFGAPVWEAGA